MAQRKNSFAIHEFYHVYNRGNSRQKIFVTQSDQQRFVNLLYVANGTKSFEFRNIKPDSVHTFERGEPLVAIGAYCLMPNHFHLLLTPLVEDGLTTFMKKLSTGYSMYFNKKHFRTGSLFEGRFKSEHVASDNHLKYLFSYIHLNPVKLIQGDWQRVGIKNRAEVLQYLRDFQYSSYLDNSVWRPESAILQKNVFPDYFHNKREYDDELNEWLRYKADSA